MPITKDINDIICDCCFIFVNKNILIKEQSGIPLSKSDLPTKDVAKKCMDAQIASDWFGEKDKGYICISLETSAPIPAGYVAIPLRQFFWDTKTPEEQNQGLPSVLGALAARAHGFSGLRKTYIYCPRCGTPMVLHPTEVAKQCPKCSRIDFPHIEPATITLVTKGDEILLVQSRNRVGNFYGLVAGFVELGETIEQCVQREISEETGLEVQNIKYVGSQTWPFPDQLMLAFTAEYKSGELKLQESELEAGGWFTKDNLPEIPRPGSVAYNLIWKHFINK